MLLIRDVHAVHAVDNRCQPVTVLTRDLWLTAFAKLTSSVEKTKVSRVTTAQPCFQHFLKKNDESLYNVSQTKNH